MAYDLTDYLNIEDRPPDYVPITEFNHVLNLALLTLLHDGEQAEDIPYVTAPMAYVLDEVSKGASVKAACEVQGLTTVQHVAWKKCNSLYAKAYDMIKQAQAEEVEDVVWQNALNPDTRNSIERMFALKSRKAEYKDNAIPQGDTNVSIRITLEGEEIPAKVIEAESEGEE